MTTKNILAECQTVPQSITITAKNIKKFANRLKSSLHSRDVEFKTSVCYEIFAETCGAGNWHELNKILSKECEILDNSIPNNSTKTSNKKLFNLFDIEYVEFKYMVAQMSEILHFDLMEKTVIDCLLDIFHTGEKSHLLWHKIEQLLSNGTFLSDWFSEGPIMSYTVLIDHIPDDKKEKINSRLRRIWNTGTNKNTAIEHANKIEKFFKMLQFIEQNNFSIKEPNTAFDVNNVLSFNTEYNEYYSDYSFISNLIRFFSWRTSDSLSFHELILNSLTRKNTISRNLSKDFDPTIGPSTSTILVPEIYNNNDFIGYLIDNLKKYKNNKYELKQQYSDVFKNLFFEHHTGYEIICHFSYIPSLSEFTKELNKIKIPVVLEEHHHIGIMVCFDKDSHLVTLSNIESFKETISRMNNNLKLENFKSHIVFQ